MGTMMALMGTRRMERVMLGQALSQWVTPPQPPSHIIVYTPYKQKHARIPPYSYASAHKQTY
eukprot:COSAG01_NODE_33123_length_569_cov_188.459574_1_plen_61_part_10